MTVLGWNLDAITVITAGLVVAGLLVAALVVALVGRQSKERPRQMRSRG